jgi:hypothetical protein
VQPHPTVSELIPTMLEGVREIWIILKKLF